LFTGYLYASLVVWPMFAPMKEGVLSPLEAKRIMAIVQS
jgi:hypothetical protein